MTISNKLQKTSASISTRHMNKFSSSVAFFNITALILTGFISPVLADETASPANVSSTRIPATDTLAATTPQPPLLESELKPNYEPLDDETTEPTKSTEDKPLDTEDNRSIGDTPQPPLIHKQVEPSYGPKKAGDMRTEDRESATSPDTEQDSDQKNQEPKPSTDKPSDEAPVTDTVIKIEDKTGTGAEAEAEKKAVIEAKKEKEPERKKWTETYPVSVNADWLQLKSGEWLRGRITILQKDNLEFDSDELDDLVIEWKNVKYLKSYEPYSMRFDSQGRASIIGIIEVVGDKVHVKTDYDDRTFDRSDLQTIASGKDTEISYWKNKVTFALNIRKGNTDQTDFTSKITAKRRTTDSRLVLDYLGNFTEVEEAETINNHRLNETYDIFLTRDLFWTPIFSEFFRDPFQNIEQRIYAGIGIGYSIINNNKTEWDISGGPAYQQTTFVSVQPGVDQVDSTLTLALGTNFETELNDRVDLEGLYSVTLGDKETGNYTHHSLFTIETELTDKLNFDVTTVWDYVRSPVTGENGITPENNDFRILIGLGYDL